MNVYVALGDSFTAGNGLESGRRWPDLLARDLSEDSPDLEYVNLARDGADSRAVLEQVPAAIAARPDLVTLVCGANDVILSLRPDIPSFAGRLELIIDRLQRSLPGVTILAATYPEGWSFDGAGPRTATRIQSGMRELNQAIFKVTASRDVTCLDVIDHPGISEPENFEPDGLHPSALGHRHAAAEFRQAVATHFPNRNRRRRRMKIWK